MHLDVLVAEFLSIHLQKNLGVRRDQVDCSCYLPDVEARDKVIQRNALEVKQSS